MKLSDNMLRQFVGGKFGNTLGEILMAQELLAARKVVEEARNRTDDMGFFNGSAHNLRTLLHAYDKATEG